MLLSSAATSGFSSSSPVIRLLPTFIRSETLTRVWRPVAHAHVFIRSVLSRTGGCSSLSCALCLCCYYCGLCVAIHQIRLLYGRRARWRHAHVLWGARDHGRREIYVPRASLHF